MRVCASWFDAVQVRYKGSTAVQTVLYVRFPCNTENFLTGSRSISFSRKKKPCSAVSLTSWSRASYR